MLSTSRRKRSYAEAFATDALSYGSRKRLVFDDAGYRSEQGLVGTRAVMRISRPNPSPFSGMNGWMAPFMDNAQSVTGQMCEKESAGAPMRKKLAELAAKLNAYNLQSSTLGLKQPGAVSHGTSPAAPDFLALQTGFTDGVERQGANCNSIEQGNNSSAGDCGSMRELKILTYNVWFGEDVTLADRMGGVGKIIEEQDYPHFICFQEVTRNILRIFRKASWWSRYTASSPLSQRYFTLLLCRKDVNAVPEFRNEDFPNSIMGRGVLKTSISIWGHSLTVATSHLESPCNGRTYHNERVAQMELALKNLNAPPSSNVIFAGDMNWLRSDGTGGPPLPDGWADAWLALHPGEEGLTYDPITNPMVTAPAKDAARLDRVFCKLRNWKLRDIQLVGCKPVKNQSSSRRFGQCSKVYPSDHFGLVLMLHPSNEACHSAKEPSP